MKRNFNNQSRNNLKLLFEPQKKGEQKERGNQNSFKNASEIVAVSTAWN